MQSLLHQLRCAIGQGVALAGASLSIGCGTSSHTPAADGGMSSAGKGGDTAPAHDAGQGGSAIPDMLEPYTPDMLTCSGPDYGNMNFGYHGRCCLDARCYTPEQGQGCGPAPTRGGSSPVRLPPGSGSCLCGEVQGPFAANPDHTPSDPGSCCYLVPKITCDGRPLCVDGGWIVAEVVARSDWAAFT